MPEIDELLAQLQEAGRTISAASADRIRQVIDSLSAALSALQEMTAPVKESSSLSNEEELETGYVPLVEGAVRRDGTVPLKLIAPGWGTSGYYPADILRRDGPKVFPAGTKQYWDHPTAQQEAERPEGSLRDLAAELIDNARYDEYGPAGPGLYANAKVFGPYKAAIDELAPHIGVSIRAQGPVQQGMAEGRTGRIVQGITSARSVDFVTAPGAGGQIVSLFEAARGNHQPPPESEEDVNEQQFKEAVAKFEEQIKAMTAQNADLTQTNARLNEALLLREAREAARPMLAQAQLPEVTQARLLESLAANPPVKDGALDSQAYSQRIQEAITAETEYLVRAAGYGSGKVTGMGVQSEAALQESKAAEERMAAGFAALGLSEAGVKQAVRGRGF